MLNIHSFHEFSAKMNKIETLLCAKWEHVPMT